MCDMRWSVASNGSNLEPQQIHVALGTPDPVTYVISWVTLGALPDSKSSSMVLFTQEDVDTGLNNSLSTWRASTSTPTVFTVKGCPQLRVLHSVEIMLPRESPHDRVHYQVGLAGGPKSGVRHFDPIREAGEDSKEPLVVTLIADFGTQEPGNVLPQLIRHTQDATHDLVIHVGDIAYNLDGACNTVGDEFMNAIQPSAQTTPWMFGPGNHEQDGWFTYRTFLQRFAGQSAAANASGSDTIRWMSFDVGLIHFAMIDTDAYVCLPVWPKAAKQAAWLKKDLASVDRRKTPWVVVLGHRPLYCTDYPLIPECHLEAAALRRGIPFYERTGIEPLLLQYKVDLYLAGHTHHYQRSWPVAHGLPTQRDYINPQAPVYIVSGIAGPPMEMKWWVKWERWEAYRDDAVFPLEGCGSRCLRRSYSQVSALNATHFRFQQRAATDASVFDEFFLVRSSEGSAINVASVAVVHGILGFQKPNESEILSEI